MMDSACYYTFSTVCQMLAGAFGFLVAVVLYRIQGIDHMLYENLDWTVGWGLESRGEYHAAKKEHDWGSIARMLREIEAPPGPTNPQSRNILEGCKNKFLALHGKLQFIKDRLRSSLTLTGLTIAGSLALLPLTPLIARSNLAASILMAVDVAIAGVCLYKYFKLAEGAAE
jgi:hypothetical protein